MFLRTLTIEGNKHFGQQFQVEFAKGMNVPVGENGPGKSAIIDAIRLLLLEDENPAHPASLTLAFYRPLSVLPPRLCHTHPNFPPAVSLCRHPWRIDTLQPLVTRKPDMA